jgi:hypothetical protein
MYRRGRFGITCAIGQRLRTASLFNGYQSGDVVMA